MSRNRRLALPLIPLLFLSAGCAPTPEAPPVPENPPMPATPSATARISVNDLVAFDALIATRPTPAELSARYPSLHLVLPGDISTRELRGDRSRYFAELDGEGRVVGGQFQ